MLCGWRCQASCVDSEWSCLDNFGTYDNIRCNKIIKLFLYWCGWHGQGQGASRLPLLEGVADGFGSSGEDFGQGPFFSMRCANPELGHYCVGSKVPSLCIGFTYTQTHVKAWCSAGFTQWRSFISSWSFGPDISKWRDTWVNSFLFSCSVAFLIQELDGS